MPTSPSFALTAASVDFSTQGHACHHPDLESLLSPSWPVGTKRHHKPQVFAVMHTRQKGRESITCQDQETHMALARSRCTLGMHRRGPIACRAGLVGLALQAAHGAYPETWHCRSHHALRLFFGSQYPKDHYSGVLFTDCCFCMECPFLAHGEQRAM